MRKDLVRVFLITSILFNASIVFTTSLADLSLASSSLPTDRPCVFVDPQETLAPKDATFTVSVSIFNLTNRYVPDPGFPGLYVPLGNLFGLDINFTWNPAHLNYVSHIVTIPVEDYPGGVLHSDPDFGVQQIADSVNQGAGTYHVAYSCFSNAPVFNNPGKSSTVFNMTFSVREKGSSNLRLASTDLSAKPAPNVNMRILHTKSDGYVETPGTPRAQFTYWPPDGKAVKNQAVVFDASGSYDLDGMITSYSWNFGDGATGNGKIVTHSYSATGVFTASLVVVDNEGTSSAPAPKTVTVVEKRDIALTGLSVSQENILQNQTVEVDFSVKNLGDVKENYTVTVNYNQTVIDWNDIAAAQWAQIGKKSGVDLGSGSEIGLSLNWNTTGVPAGMYYVLANASLVPHETNATNNVRMSSTLEVTTEIRHDVAVTSIEVVVIKGAHEFKPPLILRENGTIQVNVKAKQTSNETFSAVLRLLAPNGTVLDSKDWLAQNLQAGKTKELQFSTTKWVVGNCAITVNATILENDINQTNNNNAIAVKVVSLPVLVIASLPSPIIEGDTVSLDATVSSQQDGSLTYRWKIWAPSLNPLQDSPTSAPSDAVVSYTFATAGNWTVILYATDADAITYNEFRDATASYQKTLIVTVEAKAGTTGIPYEMIYVAIGVIVVVVIAVWVYFRLKKPKPEA